MRNENGEIVERQHEELVYNTNYGADFCATKKHVYIRLARVRRSASGVELSRDYFLRVYDRGLRVVNEIPLHYVEPPTWGGAGQILYDYEGGTIDFGYGLNIVTYGTSFIIDPDDVTKVDVVRSSSMSPYTAGHLVDVPGGTIIRV